MMAAHALAPQAALARSTTLAIRIAAVVHRLAEELGEAGALLVGWEGLWIAEAVHRLSTGIGHRRGECDGLFDPQGSADAAEMGV
jgi:hypothetical protein